MVFIVRYRLRPGVRLMLENHPRTLQRSFTAVSFSLWYPKLHIELDSPAEDFLLRAIAPFETDEHSIRNLRLSV